LRYLIGRLRQVVKVTLEVPEALLGEIYIAVGNVLENDRWESEEGAEQAEATDSADGDQAAEES
jgi:hypothetical protein